MKNDDLTGPETNVAVVWANNRNDAFQNHFLPRGPKEKAKMDWNRVEGNWKQVKGKVKEQWGKLTDDDLNVIAGRRDQLEGKLQETK